MFYYITRFGGCQELKYDFPVKKVKPFDFTFFIIPLNCRRNIL